MSKSQCDKGRYMQVPDSETCIAPISLYLTLYRLIFGHISSTGSAEPYGLFHELFEPA